MKFIELPRFSQKPKSSYVQPVSLLLAAILLLMTVAQLFKYEEFPEVLATIGIGGWEGIAAAIIVILEVAALPFLLFIQLTPAMRFLSMTAGWAVVAWWIVVSLTAAFNGAGDSGFFGAVVDVPGSWGGVFFALSLAVLMAWASWGMWPGRQSKVAKKAN